MEQNRKQPFPWTRHWYWLRIGFSPTAFSYLAYALSRIKARSTSHVRIEYGQAPGRVPGTGEKTKALS